MSEWINVTPANEQPTKFRQHAVILNDDKLIDVTKNLIPDGTFLRTAAVFKTLSADGSSTTEVAGEDGETIIIEVPRPITYNKRGFNTSTVNYEFWQTLDPLGPPPSMNTLINVTIVSQTI